MQADKTGLAISLVPHPAGALAATTKEMTRRQTRQGLVISLVPHPVGTLAAHNLHGAPLAPRSRPCDGIHVESRCNSSRGVSRHNST